MSTDTEHKYARFAELQQQWHGWGSPVGLGLGLLSVGGFVLLLAKAWSLVN